MQMPHSHAAGMRAAEIYFQRVTGYRVWIPERVRVRISLTGWMRRDSVLRPHGFQRALGEKSDRFVFLEVKHEEGR